MFEARIQMCHRIQILNHSKVTVIHDRKYTVQTNSKGTGSIKCLVVSSLVYCQPVSQSSCRFRLDMAEPKLQANTKQETLVNLITTVTQTSIVKMNQVLSKTWCKSLVATAQFLPRLS
jgi:hypothetical protein